MGCILGYNEHDDDEIYRRDNRHHHQRAHSRIIPYYSYCLNCHCQQYIQHQRVFNQCLCGHSTREHKKILKNFVFI
ncbi:unnamed protein product [Rotaria socialis]|uniref:Uncharacterized protein n=1 Tax=Rotaria socialis TaxID=392032 RepID=A0A818L4A3_9BILA|nr:unnamed protein product [Rotaria socialis]